MSRATKAYTGAYLAERIAECLRDYGIENKVCTRVRNNAIQPYSFTLGVEGPDIYG